MGQYVWIDLIEGAYQERRKKNPAYSYRAFSRDLGVSQCLLSRILSNKKKMTPEIGLRIALKLNLPDKQIIELMITTLSN